MLDARSFEMLGESESSLVNTTRAPRAKQTLKCQRVFFSSCWSNWFVVGFVTGRSMLAKRNRKQSSRARNALATRLTIIQSAFKSIRKYPADNFKTHLLKIQIFIRPKIHFTPAQSYLNTSFVMRSIFHARISHEMPLLRCWWSCCCCSGSFG